MPQTSTTFSDFLEAAEARLRTDDGCQDLSHAIVRQLMEEFRAAGAQLLVVDDETSSPVIRLGKIAGTALPPVMPLSGRTVRLDCTETDLQITTAAAVLAGSDRIVLQLATHEVCDDAAQLLVSAAEVLADLHRRRLLETHSAQTRRQRSLTALIAQLYSSLDSQVVANTLATDATVVTDAVRISVARRRGSSWLVVATTGVARPNDRSDAIRSIISILDAAETNSATDCPADRLVVPLHETESWPAARWGVVFEFSAAPDESTQHTVELICTHAAQAFAHCDELADTGFRGTLRHGVATLRRPLWLILMVAVCAGIAALLVLEAELKVEVYGELVPSDRTFIFAPDDGTIESVDVEDGTDITAGQELCRLVNEDLLVRIESAQGELAAAEGRLAAIDALKGGPRSSNDGRLLSAEQVELQEKTRSLRQQVAILEDRLSALTMTADSAGRVYGDRLKEVLISRPVQRGQYLFEIANPHGKWELDLQVAEFDVRHVLESAADSETSLAISYALETSPEVSRTAELVKLGGAANPDGSGGLTTRAMGRINEVDFSKERPGTGVIASIHCGRRRLGFVWFRKLIELVQRKTWL